MFGLKPLFTYQRDPHTLLPVIKCFYSFLTGCDLGLCRHRKGETAPQVLSTRASICPPTLTKNHVIHCGLDGVVELVPLAGGKSVELKTALDAAISAPVAVADGRIYVPCEDGLLYLFSP